MHDYHAVSALVASLAGEPDVVEVHVRASPVFSPESLQQAYEMQTAETPLAGSRLVVSEQADSRTCTACSHSWRLSYEDVAGHLVLCPACGTPAPLGEDIGLELVEVTRSQAAGARLAQPL